MNGYSTDRTWSDRYIPEMRRIIGPYLLRPSPLEVDLKEAGDLITLQARNLTIACRVRRPKYYLNPSYRWQFTIRSQRDSGARTEFAKIMSGWADWMFYAFAKSDDVRDGFAGWFLIDLGVLRGHLLSDFYSQTVLHRPPQIKWERHKPNPGDGTYFAWFDVRTFPSEPKLLIDSSMPEPPAKRTLFDNRPEPKTVEAIDR